LALGQALSTLSLQDRADSELPKNTSAVAARAEHGWAADAVCTRRANRLPPTGIAVASPTAVPAHGCRIRVPSKYEDGRLTCARQARRCRRARSYDELLGRKTTEPYAERIGPLEAAAARQPRTGCITFGPRSSRTGVVAARSDVGPTWSEHDRRLRP